MQTSKTAMKRPGFRGMWGLGCVCWLVLAMGAVPDGHAHGYLVATNFASLQAAIDAIPAGGGKLLIPAGTYTVTSTLNVTGRSHVEIVGSPGTLIQVNIAGGTAALDLTGSHHCRLYNLRVQVTGGTCKTGILLARDDNGLPAGNHYLSRVYVTGTYSVAGVYSLASEGNEFYSCHVDSAISTTNGDAFAFSSTNYAGLTSPSQGALCATGDCSGVILYGCTLSGTNQARSALYVCGNAKNLDVMDCRLHGENQAAVLIESGAGTAGRVVLSGCRSAGTPTATSFLKAVGRADQVIVRDSLLECAGGPVVNGTGATAFNWCLENNQMRATGGVIGAAFATVTDSTLWVRGLDLQGTGTPYAVQVSVTSRNNDFYVRTPAAVNYVGGCATNSDRTH